MAEKYDVVILGGGAAGEMVANTVAPSGKSVLLVEERLFGGQCPFFACMPSKAMLRSAQVRHLITKAHELGAVSRPMKLDDSKEAYKAAAKRRDEVADHLDDARHIEALEKNGVKLLRGRGQFTRPDLLWVDAAEVQWGDLVIATGSNVKMPPIEGIDSVPVWISDDVYTSDEIPSSVIILGGGATGCETAQMLAHFGCEVSLVEVAPLLLSHEEPDVAKMLEKVLQEEGVTLYLSAEATKVEAANGHIRMRLKDGSVIRGERLIVATGQAPDFEDMGIDKLGIELDEKGFIRVDQRCRIDGRERLWAVGDVTGVAQFTHLASYQGRIVASNLMGHRAMADYRAIPRVIFTDPPVAGVGLTPEEAKQQGIDVVTTSMSIGQTAKSATYGDFRGTLVLVGDRSEGILVGASAIGPNADEWIGEAGMAIFARVPVIGLVDMIHAFPTFSEVYEPPLREMASQMLRSGIRRAA